ncbi:hypothetical protein D7231_33685 [Streptomyces klenkii]|uniref:DUF937 domain-containing protein n=1 Tax=Streptomyces klenkii TaxID=1420899 RepID=A0A3B0AL85_9ACTN|nr:YidB family protein [Streptomyces klenkii]RKN60027.1 hypothetical protein D7231_33685 [Streptomyces klenkii]
MESWIGTGANEPLTASEVVTIVGADTLAEVAQQTGTDSGALADYVAERLPVLIDQISPDGQITSDPEVLDQALTNFKSEAPFTARTIKAEMAPVRSTEFIILQFMQNVAAAS